MPVEFAAYTPLMIVTLMSGAFLAAAVVGAAGFGDGLVLGAVWFHVFEPAAIVPVILIQGLFVYGGTLIPLRRQLAFRYLPALAIGGVLGTPIGLWLLGIAEPDTVKVALGVLLLSIASARLLAPNLGTVTGGGRALDGLVGGIAGVLGSFAGLAGVLPTLWAEMRGWPAALARGAYQPFVIVTQVAGLIGFALVGGLDWGTAVAFAFAAPAAAAGAVFGVMVFRRLPPTLFRKGVLVLVALSGAGLLV